LVDRLKAVEGAGVADEKAPSVRELVERNLAAYRKAQECHDTVFGAACPYNFFPGPWVFRLDNVGLTRAEFEAEIRRFEEACRRDDPSWDFEPWDPQEVVLGVGHVLILYEPDPPDRRGRSFYVADLRSEDGEKFTAGEFLYQFYRAAAGDLRDSYHCHFEGLQFRGVASTPEGHVPIYQVSMGS
jgi:hypothetical protein